MVGAPLILGIGLIAVGWASGGGAAQVLFTLFSEIVFNRGAQGLGQLWGTAGVGLLVGGLRRQSAGQDASASKTYKRTVFFCYLLHGAAYVVFSQMPNLGLGSVLHGLVARGGRGQLGVELVESAEARRRPLSRPRLLDHRNHELVDHDDLHDGRRRRFAVLQHPRDRCGFRPAELIHRDLLGLGELDRQAPRARLDRRR